MQDYVLNTEFVTRKSEELTISLWVRLFGSSHQHLRRSRIVPTALKKEEKPLEQQLLTVDSLLHTVGPVSNNSSSQTERPNQMKIQVAREKNENKAMSEAPHLK